MTASISPDATATAPLARTVLCDLAGYAVLAIDGADAQTFLQGQLSNDMRRLAAGTWQYTTFNSPKGRMLASMILWREDDAYRALLCADIAEAVRKRLAMFVLRSKVVIRDATTDHAPVGLAGAGSADLVRDALGAAPERNNLVIAGSRRALLVGPDRFIVASPAHDDLRQALAARVQTRDPQFWQWLDVRAGIPWITRATQDEFVLQTANLDALQAVSFDKGCYTGQEIIARMQYLGRLKERLFLWHARTGPVKAGAKLYSPVFPGQACGTVMNAAAAPAGGFDLLAVVQLAAAEAADVRVHEPEGERLEPLPLPYELPQPAGPRRKA